VRLRLTLQKREGQSGQSSPRDDIIVSVPERSTVAQLVDELMRYIQQKKTWTIQKFTVPVLLGFDHRTQEVCVFDPRAQVSRSGLVSGMSVWVSEAKSAYGLPIAKIHPCSVPLTRHAVTAARRTQLVMPEPIRSGFHRKISLVTLTVPLLIGVVIFSITRSSMTIAFLAMSPVLALGTWLGNVREAKKLFEKEAKRMRNELSALSVQVSQAHQRQREQREEQAPGCQRLENALTGALKRSLNDYDALLWSQSVTDQHQCRVRLGVGNTLADVSFSHTGSTASQAPVEQRQSRSVRRELSLLEEEMQALTGNARTLRNAVVFAPSLCNSSIGIIGDLTTTAEQMRNTVLSLAMLFPPSELEVNFASCREDFPAENEFGWLGWLPHLSDSAPAGGDGQHQQQLAFFTQELLGAGLSRLKQHIGAQHRPGDSAVFQDANASQTQLRLWIVLAGANAASAEFVKLASKAEAAGVRFIWLCESERLLPAACKTWVRFNGDEPALVHRGSNSQTEVTSFMPDAPLTLLRAHKIARQLAPLRESAVSQERGQRMLPTFVGIESMSGHVPRVDDAQIGKAWITNARGESASGAELADGLSAAVGVTLTDRHKSGLETVALDLVAEGPHALICGTTGSGKSEFMQTWLLALASNYSPQAVHFLLIDFKGGAAFELLSSLPHTSGLVTDLAPMLAERVLVSLRAEIRRREKILQRFRAEDLADLIQGRPEEAPARLIVVIDEFATLAAQLPHFVSGVVDIAQRGRSLGIHLILATQHAGTAVTESLRANINIFVDLRPSSSPGSGVVTSSGSKKPVNMDVPGRAAIRRGASRSVIAQTAILAQIDEGESIFISSLFKQAGGRDRRVGTRTRSTKISHRVCSAVLLAAQRLGVREAHRPWQEALPDRIDWPVQEADEQCTAAAAAKSRSDSELCIGVLDLPEQQVRAPLIIDLKRTAHCAVFGTGGSGKTAMLQTVIAESAYKQAASVYVLCSELSDFQRFIRPGAPICGLFTHTDLEGVTRTLRALTESISADHPTSFVLSGTRKILLIDNLAQFREVGDQRPDLEWEKHLAFLLRQGASRGVHCIITADRSAAFSSALLAHISCQLVLSLANANEYSYFGLRVAPQAQITPGRGVLLPDRHEFQIAHVRPVGMADVNEVATCAAKNSRPLSRAATISVLPRRLRLAQIKPAHTSAEDTPVGLRTDTFAPVRSPVLGAVAVSGPGGSGVGGATRAILGRAREVWGSHGKRFRTLVLDDSGSPQNLIDALERLIIEETSSPDSCEELCCVVLPVPSLGDEQQLDTARLLNTKKSLRHLLIVQHDPTDTRVNWELQRHLANLPWIAALSPSLEHPRTLLRLSNLPPELCQNAPGRGVVQEKQLVSRVQFAYIPRNQEMAAA
jgi:S-DNA-T family DNA segregation ATPase FtsK/SpoIIIE